MKRSTLIAIVVVAACLPLFIWALWPTQIHADKVFDKRFRRTTQFIQDPMLVKVIDAKDDLPIVWYNFDHGPCPVSMEKLDDDTWRITLKRKAPPGD
jgi:hypothetical protein